VGASMAAPHHLHSTQYSTSLAGPPSLGWNVANLGVDTIQPQLWDSLAAPGVAITLKTLDVYVEGGVFGVQKRTQRLLIRGQSVP
jgi:hypothetical protein